MPVEQKSEKRAGKKRKGRSVAPGQHLGYTLQETLLTHYLLDTPRGCVLSLEVVDDVGIASPDGTAVAVQSKSALVGNPIADHSLQLWKTFANWLHLIAEGSVTLESTTFILYVSRPTAGAIAESFHKVSSIEEAIVALEDVRNSMWGEPPNYAKRPEVAESIRDYVTEVLEDANTPALLARFKLKLGSGSPMSDLTATLEKQFLAEGQIQELLHQILGWVRVRVAGQLEQKKPAFISRDEFYTETNAFVRKISVRNILRSFARQPTPEEQEAELTRMYVRQLRLIDLDDDDVLAAVSDFLRAASDRVDWAKKGLVHESSFDEFNDALHGAWRNHRIGALARYPAEPTSHGQSLYSDCMTHKAFLEGIVTQDDFVRGCFHALSDELAVGWHPDYKAELGDTEVDK